MTDRHLGLVDIGQNPLATIVIGRTNLGQADPPGGTVEQTHAQTVLERGQLLADHRGGNIFGPRGAGEAAAELTRAEAKDPDSLAKSRPCVRGRDAVLDAGEQGRRSISGRSSASGRYVVFIAPPAELQRP